MVFRIDHEFLLIGTESSGFTKNYFYEWDDGLGGGKSQLFLNLTFDSTEVSGEEIGDMIFEVIKNYFFHDLERDGGDRFEDMLKEVNHVIKQKEEELGMELIPKMQTLVAAIAQNMLYLSQRGQTEAYLVRRRFVSNLTDGLSDPKNKEELFANISSGGLAAGDSVLLCSTRLLRYITKSDLGRLISEEPKLEGALDSIADAVSLDLMEQVNVLGIHVGEEMITVIQGDDEDVEGDALPAGFSFGKMTSKFKLHLGKLIPKRGDGSIRDRQEEVSNKALEVIVEEEVDESEMDDPRETDDSSQPSAGSGGLSLLMKEWKELKRDKILVALIAVVLMLLVGIYLVRHQGQKQNYIDELESQLEQVEININTAQTTGSYDKESAKELLDEAEELALEVLNSGYLRGKASEYLTDIEEQRDYLDNVNRIAEPTVFLDLALDYPSINALGLVPLGESLYVYEYNQLYEIILDEIQAPLTIDADEVITEAASYEDNESLLFLTKSSRIIEYRDQQFSFVDTDDGSWHSAVDIAVYNGRIYLLDANQGQIWRYYGQRSSYSGAEGYVVDDTDLTGAVSFAIDGAIFVLGGDGEIMKFLSGENAELSVSKAPTTDLSGADTLYTEFEMFQVFLLDPSGSRVLVYNKDSRTGNLVYSSQFVFENAETLRDIYVDKESSRVYVLGQTKIYELDY